MMMHLLLLPVLSGRHAAAAVSGPPCWQQCGLPCHACGGQKGNKRRPAAPSLSVSPTQMQDNEEEEDG